MSSIREKINQINIDYAEKIYNLAFLCGVLKAMFAFSELITNKNFFNAVFNVAFFGIMIYKLFFLQKYSIAQIFTLIITGLACAYTDFSIWRVVFVPAFLMIAATQGIDLKKSMRFMWKVQAVILAIHVMIYPIMYTFFGNRVGITVRGYNNDNRIRHQFLFSHANVFSMLLLWTIFGYIYANFDKLDKKRIVACWGVYAFFYLYTDSNSGMIILSVVSVLLIIRDLTGEKFDVAISFLSRYLFIILALFFNAMMVSLPQLTGDLREKWKEIDSFFTGRLKYGAYIFDKYGFTLLGRPLNIHIRDYWEGFWIDGLPADNMYMFFSVWYGLFFSVLIAYLFWRYSKYATTAEMIIIIAYSLYTMMESYIIYVQFCFALLLVMRHVWVDHIVTLPKDKGKKAAV